jgi:SAM-dependent methyltransferase
VSEVKSFWNERAADPSLDPAQVTHPDVWQRWLEIETIKQLLPVRKRIIDIGCGSGFGTKQFAPLAESIVGIDYSAGMIERAKNEGGGVPSNAAFMVGDVLDLTPNKIGLFDVAITIRCLINLPDWQTQQRALVNIARIVKPNGHYIFVEGIRDGREALNRLRTAVGLEAMPPVWHNVDFDSPATLDFLLPYFELQREIGFGTYDVITRVFHPLFVAPDVPRYVSKINELAARVALERPADMANSRTAVYFLRRR